MTNAELQQAILDTSHRPDLATFAPGFIKLAEDQIARTLRASEQVERVMLGEAARVDGARYQLPADFLEHRAFYYGDCVLNQVALAELRRLRARGVAWFSILGQLVEFKDAPATNAEVELIYFRRMPRLVAPADTHVLLANHDAVYLHNALHYLYVFTQDLELADQSARVAAEAIETLNEQAGRALGGSKLGSVGPHNFSSRRSY